MPHSGGKICAPYSLDTSKSRASAAVTVVTTTVRIGAERPRDCITRSTSSHSNAPIAATAYTRPYSVVYVMARLWRRSRQRTGPAATASGICRGRSRAAARAS